MKSTKSSKTAAASGTADKIRNMIKKIIDNDYQNVDPDFITELSSKLPTFYKIEDYYKLDFPFFQREIVDQTSFTAAQAIDFLKYANTKYKNEYDADTKQSAAFKLLPFINLTEPSPESAAAVLGTIQGIPLFEDIDTLSLLATGVDRDYDYDLERKDHEIQTLKAEKKNQALHHTTFYSDCKNGDVKKVKLALDNHPEYINMQNIKGWTPLHFAVYYQRYPLLKFLLDHHANPNIKTKDLMMDVNSPSKQVTPLHLAVMKDDINAIEQLINNGADTNIRDEAGKTPSDYASNDNIRKALNPEAEK